MEGRELRVASNQERAGTRDSVLRNCWKAGSVDIARVVEMKSFAMVEDGDAKLRLHIHSAFKLLLLVL